MEKKTIDNKNVKWQKNVDGLNKKKKLECALKYGTEKH